MMVQTFLWFCAIGLSFVPLWILWRAGKKAASLDFRLSQNDASLLDDNGVIITQITGLPPNTRIIPNANVVVMQSPVPQANGASPENLA
jgi:hypothetical protein